MKKRFFHTKAFVLNKFFDGLTNNDITATNNFKVINQFSISICVFEMKTELKPN